MHERPPARRTLVAASRRLVALALGLALWPAVGPAQQSEEPTLPRFVDGQAQIVDGFRNPSEWIQHDLWVETGFDSDDDGRPDRMHVDVTRPRQTDTEGLKVAVIYETSPYFSGVSSTDRRYFWDPHQEVDAPPPPREHAPSIQAQTNRPLISRSLIGTWVPRGFAVVHSESPGTGLSQGCPTCGGSNEALAPKAVVDWLNGRAKGYTTPDGSETVEAYWCTGKVGMTGASYNGTLPLAAATTGVEGLEVILPIAPNTSYYHYYRSNGLVRHPGGWMGEDIDVLYDFINSGDPERRPHCNTAVRDGVLAASADRVTGDLNDFWVGRDYGNQLDKVHAAVLLCHGFNDWNVMPEHSIRIFKALQARGVPTGLVMHQGGHGGSVPFDMMNRWFTHYLYGIDNGVEKDPVAWVVREGDRMSNPTPYPDYPNPDAALVSLHPRKGGNGVGDLLPAAAPDQGRETLVDDVSQTGAELASAERSEHRLLFATPALTAPVHVSGTPRIRIRLASSKPAANLSVWLVSLPWQERGSILDNIITRGWADPQNHASLTDSEPLEPGRFYELSFDLQPDDQIIPAGQRIGLMIFSSDRDFTLWPPPGTELTVDLDATSLTLPIVGGADALKAATAPRSGG
ncbi:MAG: Xaa-Pro dipeptidyl-peptidase [Planctomycetes bacterium]|nr:Xaa-Pro dipeptidyl-peptidase [Planctomycetota bacterium]